MISTAMWIKLFSVGGVLAAALTKSDFNNYKFKNEKRKMATAKLGNKKELKEVLGKNGLQVSKEYTLNEKACYECVGIFAPIGAGKTTSAFIPNLLREDLMCSSFSSDTLPKH
jgi:type IV secretion system protein VirD4